MLMNLEESYKTIYGLNLATIDHNSGKKMANFYQNLPLFRTFQVLKSQSVKYEKGGESL